MCHQSRNKHGRAIGQEYIKEAYIRSRDDLEINLLLQLVARFHGQGRYMAARRRARDPAHAIMEMVAGIPVDTYSSLGGDALEWRWGPGRRRHPRWGRGRFGHSLGQALGCGAGAKA